MAEAISTPRINSPYLDSFTNQTIRLVGKVVQLRGGMATIDSQGHVTAHLNRVSLGTFLPLYLVLHISITRVYIIYYIYIAFLHGRPPGQRRMVEGGRGSCLVRQLQLFCGAMACCLTLVAVVVVVSAGPRCLTLCRCARNPI